MNDVFFARLDTALPISRELSRRFAVMSFLAALMVVMLHTGSAQADHQIQWWLHNLISGGLCRVAIPWFFFAAGFFLAGHVGEDGWWSRELKKRVRTLLVPFWIWSAIIAVFWLFIAIFIREFNYEYNGPNAFSWFTWSGILTILGLNPFGNIPTMWFLRTLFLLVALSPLFIRTGLAGVLLLYLGYFFVETGVVEGCILRDLLSLRGACYFCAGIYFRWHDVHMTRRYFPLCAILGLSLLLVKLLLQGNLSMAFDVVMVPLLMISCFAFLSGVKIPVELLNLSFPIYLLHSMVSYGVSAVYGILGVGAGRTSFVLGFIRFAVTIILTISMAKIIKRIMPRFSNVAFGNRI